MSDEAHASASQVQDDQLRAQVAQCERAAQRWEAMSAAHEQQLRAYGRARDAIEKQIGEVQATVARQHARLEAVLAVNEEDEEADARYQRLVAQLVQEPERAVTAAKLGALQQQLDALGKENVALAAMVDARDVQCRQLAVSINSLKQLMAAGKRAGGAGPSTQ